MSSAPAHPRPPLAWGLFLGVSWTWCIGMFLPVLLLRDLGPASFLVFALPNVLGAAGMAWVLHRDGQSESWVAQHRVACVAFSVVTILFHVFFAGWVISLLLGTVGGLLAIALAAMLWAVGRTRPGRDVTASMVIYLVSLICVGLFLTYGRIHLPGQADLLLGADLKLLCLAPVSFFGFALCPYLDLTFHRARQATNPRSAQVAFGTGFGLFFFSMILFTLLYSGTLTDRLHGYAIGLAGTIVGAHMATQAGFTIAAHLREILAPTDVRRDSTRLTIFTLASMGLVAAIAYLTAQRPATGEVPYLLFMGFYGLVFPAYAWAALAGRGRINWRILAAGVLLAMPCYYVGFVARQMVWLVPGLAIALVAGVISAKTLRRPQTA